VKLKTCLFTTRHSTEWKLKKRSTGFFNTYVDNKYIINVCRNVLHSGANPTTLEFTTTYNAICRAFFKVEENIYLFQNAIGSFC
jgi:hypothetical protein